MNPLAVIAEDDGGRPPVKKKWWQKMCKCLAPTVPPEVDDALWLSCMSAMLASPARATCPYVQTLKHAKSAETHCLDISALILWRVAVV